MNHKSHIKMSTNKRHLCPLVIAIGVVLLTACGEERKITVIPNAVTPNENVQTTPPLTSALVGSPELVKKIKATEFAAMLQKADPYAVDLTPPAKCDVRIHKITYNTVGAKDEPTTATAAVMLPAGNMADCGGARPILLYAHGTATNKSYDFTQVGNNNNDAGQRATNIAANFAAQGYIVVAPNYAGYDKSPLTYTPYLNAHQQSQEMATALASARESIGQMVNANKSQKPISDSGKLFISGYSQGGHVALATAQYLQLKNQPVTAIAPMSGPYAMAALGDRIFLGEVSLGATVFSPLLAINYQKQYGNIYDKPSDIIIEKYAKILDNLPGEKSSFGLISSGELPLVAFEKNPDVNNYPKLQGLSAKNESFALSVDKNNYLVNTKFRADYVADAIEYPDGLTKGADMPMPAADAKFPLRQALKDNDLRNFKPTMPTLFCGGSQDQVVYYDTNTGGMKKVLNAISAKDKNTHLNVSFVDVDAKNATAQNQPTLTVIGEASKHKTSLEAIQKDVQNKFAVNYEKLSKESPIPLITDLQYHSTLTSSACTAVTREYFKEFM